MGVGSTELREALNGQVRATSVYAPVLLNTATTSVTSVREANSENQRPEVSSTSPRMELIRVTAFTSHCHLRR